MRRSKAPRSMRLLFALVAVLLVPSLLFAAVQFVALDLGFYEQQFLALDLSQATGVSPQELRQAMRLLLDYIRGEADSIVLTVSQNGAPRAAFDEREQLHMEDVRDLYRGFSVLRNGTFLLLAVALLLLRMRKESAADAVARGGAAGFAFVLVLLAALTVWALIDFNGFWNALHGLLFRNDLWLLDSRVSLMINMLPLQLFFNLVFRVLAVGLALIACPIACVIVCRIHCRRCEPLIQ